MKMLAKLFACLISALPIPALAQTPWPEECKLTQIASFPMTVVGGHVTIPGTVNGKDKTFLVDTGGYASALTNAAAADLGLQAGKITQTHIRDVGGKEHGGYVRAQSFTLGQMRAKDFAFMLMESASGADGLIAPDLLLQFDVEMDFGAMRMNLFKPHPCSGKAAYWGVSYAAQHFDLTDDGHVRVNISLDGKDATAILDTGSPVSLLGLKAAGRLFNLDEKSPGVTSAGILGGGAGGEIATFAYPFKTLNMGGVNVANPRIFLSDGKSFSDSDRAQGLIGLNVLRHLHLYFAYKERELYISAAGRPQTH